jgi:hypothetical protein
MRNELTNSVFVIAFIGACALAQDQGQPRAVASISDISAENAPSASSLRQGIRVARQEPGDAQSTLI